MLALRFASFLCRPSYLVFALIVCLLVSREGINCPLSRTVSCCSYVLGLTKLLAASGRFRVAREFVCTAARIFGLKDAGTHIWCSCAGDAGGLGDLGDFRAGAATGERSLEDASGETTIAGDFSHFMKCPGFSMPSCLLDFVSGFFGRCLSLRRC